MITRNYCCECGRPESWWSAFKHYLRWSRLGKWWRPYVPGPYQLYWDEKLLKHAAELLNVSELGKPKEFPKNAGATTIRFHEGHKP